MATATATGTAKRMYIDGQWCDADDGKTLAVINPADEEVDRRGGLRRPGRGRPGHRGRRAGACRPG